jgi:hypothetical protein
MKRDSKRSVGLRAGRTARRICSKLAFTFATTIKHRQRLGKWYKHQHNGGHIRRTASK